MPDTGGDMVREQVEAVVRRLLEAHTVSNPASLEGLFAPGYVNHTGPGGQQSAEARRRQVMMFHAAAPDLRTQIDDLLVVGDTAVVRWTTRATFTGQSLETAFGPVEPRGQKIEFSGVNIIRTKGDQITEEWYYWEETKWLQQLGVAPRTSA
jgi:predicted ester cyclase